MNIINIKNIINEELNKFDFLGNDMRMTENDAIELISNEDLQKQFISDTLLNRDKIEIIKTYDAILSGDLDNNFSIKYGIVITYKYDTQKPKIRFELEFDGDEINVIDNGNENHINWHTINVNLYSENGDKVEFIAFEKAPQNIKTYFIREYLEFFVVSHANTSNNDFIK